LGDWVIVGGSLLENKNGVNTLCVHAI